MKNSTYFKNLDFLRFVFILIIVCCHLQHGAINPFYDKIHFYKTLHDWFTYSWLPVEFFFIISGFFLFLKTDFNQKFITFAKNKLIRFIPLILFSMGCWFVANIFLPIGYAGHENIFTILCIQNIGLTFSNGNVPASWFISALFWTMCFYFYLYKITTKEWFNMITACIVLFCYSFWLHTSGTNTDNVAYVFNIGAIRALAGLGLGYFISMAYQESIDKIKNFHTNKLQTLIISATEYFLLFHLIFNTCLHKMHYGNRFILVLNFIGLFLLFLIKKGHLSRILDNNFSTILGKSTFGIFLTHQFIIRIWNVIICQWHPNLVIKHPFSSLFLLFSIIIAFGIFAHYKVEIPLTKYLKKKLG